MGLTQATTVQSLRPKAPNHRTALHPEIAAFDVGACYSRYREMISHWTDEIPLLLYESRLTGIVFRRDRRARVACPVGTFDGGLDIFAATNDIVETAILPSDTILVPRWKPINTLALWRERQGDYKHMVRSCIAPISLTRPVPPALVRTLKDGVLDALFCNIRPCVGPVVPSKLSRGVREHCVTLASGVLSSVRTIIVRRTSLYGGDPGRGEYQ
jgi:hypothetical protein